jgi:hypothetical protein
MTEAVGLPTEGLRWLIQSPSETGRRMDLGGIGLDALWPVEEVRGGIAFGDRMFSDAMADGSFKRDFLWSAKVRTNRKWLGDFGALEFRSRRSSL